MYTEYSSTTSRFSGGKMLARRCGTPPRQWQDACSLSARQAERLDSRRIAELTEELEELKSEKDMLLNSLDCADDADISTVKKEIATLESGLKKLEEQETKYSAELDEALKQYAELKEQAAGMDAVELMDARLDIRKEQERSAIDRVKAAYGEKYDFALMAGCKQDVASLLHEETEIRAVREQLLQKRQQAQQKQTPKIHQDSRER